MFARFRTIVLVGLAGAAVLAPLPALAQADEEPLARFEDALCPGVLGLRQGNCRPCCRGSGPKSTSSRP